MELVASKEDITLRLDEALTKRGIAKSRTAVQKMIKDGLVLVNGKKEKAHYALEEGDVITYSLPEAESSSLTPEDIPLDIVYEDEDLLIINKPAGLVVHPGNGHHEGTLANGLLFHISKLANIDDPVRPGLVHRIDKDTSGLLAVAKTDLAFDSLTSQLSDHSMHREYLALVKGIIKENEAKIDAPLGRDPKSPIKFKVDVINGKEAITTFKVLKRFPSDNVTLISCRLYTGRTHQIRVHLDYIGHPIVGDLLYGENNKALYDKGQLLHAYRLILKHPKNQKTMSFYAMVPDYFSSIIAKLN